MASWHDLPAEVKFVILEHFVDGILRLPITDGSWWLWRLISLQRAFIANLEYTRRVDRMPPLTESERCQEMERFGALKYAEVRQKHLVRLHSGLFHGHDSLLIVLKKAIVNLLVAVPELEAELSAMLKRKQKEVTPSFRGAKPAVYGGQSNESEICQCAGTVCGFVRMLSEFMEEYVKRALMFSSI